MKSQLLAATAVALFAFAPASAQAPKPAKPTPAEAKAFVDKAEAELAAFNQYVAKSAWVRATYITEDTQWLEAKATAEQNELTARYAREAAKYDGVAVDPVTARKLKLLKLFLVSPAPNRPGAAGELATIATRLDSTYSAGKFQHGGKTLTLNDAEEILAKSRDPAELKAVWEGWHSVAPQMRGDYAKLAELSNEGARDLGFKDTGALWRSNYDMDPDKFAAETDRLWSQVEPFYRNLHCYVRGQLNDKYGDAVQPRKGPIRADLLGNMWAQQWGNVYDVVQPKTASSSYSLDKLLVSKGYDPVKMVKTGESFYTSVGISPLPDTFWKRSMITRPQDREVVCHASAWDLDDRDDVRIKMCTKVDADDFYTVHHELGHNVYQRAYKDQPFLFKNGANDGFHEAIGDFVGLSALTPTYLQQIGLLDKAPGADEDIPFLLKMALDKIAFLPFGLMVDRWRWEVFSGEATPEHYNDEWWKLRLKYQGLTPPGPRPADAFDPAAKYHVPANVPYTRYFLAHIYQFQFHRAACNQIGWKGPLHRCSVYGEKEMGQKFNAMLEMGASKPWPEAMAAFTGEKNADASAVTAYFKPLNDWLTVQNKGESCGW
ncbi:MULTISPECIES: M2 family metallopeptidase [unclassified Phenylobacterium]|uniref:M2 family metallopeptidase n=1 Tax=unclassified Phenylobacterium TaxID=2640670 RepID=UPI0022B3790F|nr:M2 family metallopeptidase [Phenylobacterium sp. NIBR 498073]MBS0492149.1 M2 family metallopeptidase [Pseudomonadota bacterium]WGU40711.1 M2 family metallopeptidase [Phenylobacterium sp. NIBR 498073]